MGRFNDEATRLLNSEQRRLVERLAEIEASDQDACAGCGGEDCACCEIYLDRQRWEPLDCILDRMEECDEFYGRYRHVDYEEEDEMAYYSDLLKRALRLLRRRSADTDMYSLTERKTYESAAQILEYALTGNEECLAQFEYYDDWTEDSDDDDDWI